MATEQGYTYASASTFVQGADAASLRLATSGGDAPLGRLLAADVADPRAVAQALLVVAEVAGTRFYTPSAMIRARILAADPVVTCSADGVRFESFSACCGVYARLDVDAAALAGELVQAGTTNVDFNAPLRGVLAGVLPGDRLRLCVGLDGVEVETSRGSAFERKVELPERWVKGFGETQAASAAMLPRHDLTPVEARRFVQALPRGGGRGLAWVVSAGRGLRLASRPGADGIPLSGPERLRPLTRMLAIGAGLRICAPLADGDEPAATAWIAELPGARLVVVVSPEPGRAFSGEGAVLDAALAADEVVVAAVEAELSAGTTIDPHAAAARLGASVPEVVTALGALAGGGRVGYDLHDGGWFGRALPFDRELLGALHPRLRSAARLVEQGRVELVGDEARVTSGGVVYIVRSGAGPRCLCPWVSRYGTGRGPCKHILAADAARRAARAR